MEFRKEDVAAKLEELFKTLPGNVIEGENALPGCEGLVMYEAPLLGVASAEDPLFEKYKDPKVIGKPYMTPEEWLPGAKTVISFFLPFTQEVKKANRGNPEETANEWLHARIEGQTFLAELCVALQDWLKENGIESVVPAVDSRFAQTKRPFQKGEPSTLGFHFASTWSERHAAYASGLGTFSLTRAIITEKGMAGRFGSLIIDATIPADTRPYEGLYDYCIRCGACIRNCPKNAISFEKGKDQLKCAPYVNGTKKTYAPRYGCGKCQVGTPCESRIPKRPIAKAQ